MPEYLSVTDWKSQVEKAREEGANSDQLLYLGTGRFSDVHVMEEGGQLYARKLVTRKEKVSGLLKEVRINEKLGGSKANSDCPFIIGMIRHAVNSDGRSLELVLELAEVGSMYNVFTGIGRLLNPNEGAFYFAELIEALLFIHSQGVVHCDIQLPNILVKGDGHIKVTDFGSSVDLPLGATHVISVRIGSFHYPPEIQDVGSELTHSVDWYAAGTVLHQFFHVRGPFNYERGGRKLVCSHLLPGTMVNLLEAMLHEDPGQRLEGEAIFNHPWMAEQSQLAPLHKNGGVMAVRERIRTKGLTPPIVPHVVTYDDV